MLNAVLEKLSAIFSKSFIIASFFPLLLAFCMNAVLLYATSGWFRDFVDGQTSPITLTALTLRAAVAVFALLVLTYVLSSLSSVLRALLLGNRWPRWLAAPFLAIQGERLRSAEQKLQVIENERNELDADRWLNTLLDLKKKGRWSDRPFTGLRPYAMSALRRVRRAWRFGAVPHLRDLLSVRRALGTALLFRRYGDRLQELHEEFDALLHYASDRMDAEAKNLLNYRTARFSTIELAPTAIGNVALSVESYAWTRYHFNIEFFWGRLQKVVQSDEKFYAVLQDAKTQVDFSIATFWLVVLTAVVWLTLLPLVATSVVLFAVAAIVLLSMVGGMYAVCVATYHAFADTLKGSVDLYRHGLAKELRLKYPATLQAEKENWKTVDAALAYGEDKDMVFDHHGMP